MSWFCFFFLLDSSSPQCYTVWIPAALSKLLPNAHKSLHQTIHYAYNSYDTRLVEIKTTFCRDKEVLNQCQQQISLLPFCTEFYLPQLHGIDRGTETLKMSDGKPLACLTLVLKEIWAGTDETMLYCQIWRGIRLCCCYWHIFPSSREKERTTLKYNNLSLFNSLLLARPWRSLISSSVGQTVSSPGCCCIVLTWLILIQHWGCQKISLTTEEHKIRNKLLICLYYPHSVA